MNTLDLDKVEIPNVGRFYRSPKTKLWYPSITTVTGHKKAKFFSEWRKKPENAVMLSRAAKTGTAVHSIIEKYLNKEDVTDTSKFTLMDKLLFQQIKPEIDKITDIVIQEKSLFSDTARIAGRVDCIGFYDGKLSVIDFKTSRKQKKPEWISHYFEQATGYAIMYEEMTGQKIDDIIILMTCDDGETQIFKEKTKDHVGSLVETIKSYWAYKDFNKFQEMINGG